MKKISTIIILTLCILAICSTFFMVGFYFKEANAVNNYYGMTAIVTNISRPLDCVTIEDCNGNLWQFDGVEDYEIGDICSCVMSNNNTEDTIIDDTIVSVQYGGHFEGWGD